MVKSTVITIGRQYGSGGRDVGIELARREGIPYYDKELLVKAAQDSGLNEGIFEDFDEKPKRLLYAMAMDPYSFGYTTGPADQVGTDIEAAFDKAIKEVASEGPCVIIGRCADYVLQEYDKVMRIFLYSPLETRVKVVMSRENLSEEDARKRIRKIDKERASYYNFYTSQKWNDMGSYDVCLNTGLFKINDTVSIIQDILSHQDRPVDER
ncbi:MAG: cytidylate kinase-like family protein [Eubacteriaceae bacterium]|jgi:cytidylate kinase|nr:cytidylate kinase-like family protein [Eubacteriaceae bacterium]